MFKLTIIGAVLFSTIATVFGQANNPLQIPAKVVARAVVADLTSGGPVNR